MVLALAKIAGRDLQAAPPEGTLFVESLFNLVQIKLDAFQAETICESRAAHQLQTTDGAVRPVGVTPDVKFLFFLDLPP